MNKVKLVVILLKVQTLRSDLLFPTSERLLVDLEGRISTFIRKFVNFYKIVRRHITVHFRDPAYSVTYVVFYYSYSTTFYSYRF
jgi:hypothetical protein